LAYLLILTSTSIIGPIVGQSVIISIGRNNWHHQW